VQEHEEGSHSARSLIFIFLVCVAVCAIFFSMGFLVGYNERGSHSVPVAEVVTPPPVIPPTVNPPSDSGLGAAPDSAAIHTVASGQPDTEVVPAGGGGSTPPPPVAKPADASPPAAQPEAAAKPVSNPSTPAAPGPGAVGEGITLQVAALRTKQDAEHLVEILKARGYPVFMVTPEYAQSDDNLYRVQVGPFKTKEDADKARTKLSQEGFKPFVRR
jgi:cell division septation protein DedD